jgi:hypothetical protein
MAIASPTAGKLFTNQWQLLRQLVTNRLPTGGNCFASW